MFKLGKSSRLSNNLDKIGVEKNIKIMSLRDQQIKFPEMDNENYITLIIITIYKIVCKLSTAIMIYL